MIFGMEQAGVDHEALLDTYIRAINVVTQGRPDDLTIGVHMCRGNFKVCLFLLHGSDHLMDDINFQGGMHFTEGGYERIAIKVFNALDVDLEYDTERAGDFQPLKFLPLGKVVVLGLVTTKNPKDEIKKLSLLVEAAKKIWHD
ncbi:Putative protein YxjH [Psilocybe cubensis]|uniref:Uncharacterized protein n=1 Tax=Psilocybe cubensis TaxID=181762 RepID=A0ACB8HH36_PSICU|nr:Putative protein YxjH [Psilocybe cubensis]KAH9487004.1 Putative protein YxjH [Psilocybe cubensis]